LPQKPTETVKPIKPKMMPKIEVKQLTHEEYLHRSVQSKLRGQGDYWSMIGTDLSREEKLHISNCDSCSKLWAKRRGSFNDLPKSPWEPAESTESEEAEVQTERDRQLNDAMREEGFGKYM
jgi:hypothetical protein